jgi:hypothetical protein
MLITSLSLFCHISHIIFRGTIGAKGTLIPALDVSMSYVVIPRTCSAVPSCAWSEVLHDNSGRSPYRQLRASYRVHVGTRLNPASRRPYVSDVSEFKLWSMLPRIWSQSYSGTKIGSPRPLNPPYEVTYIQ